MAGQRTGRSRFGFKMLLLTVLCCALHLKELNGYRTLAVPGAGAPNRAELQKMKKTELKEKLREKGLNVSGLKPDLVERLMEHTPMKTSLEPRQIPEALKLADPDTDVFIPLNDTVQQLQALLQKKRVVFVRGGVACGKSTLARYLCRKEASKYLPLTAPEDAGYSNTEDGWKAMLSATLQQEPSMREVVNRSLQDDIKWLHDNDRVLVIDECHSILSCINFLNHFLKPKHPEILSPPMMLLLSTTSDAKSAHGEIYTTPAEITAKYMWTPPIPLASQLVHQLAAADVNLTEDAIDFFMRLCGGHRSIFMRSMQWVHDMQMKEKKSTPWDVRRSLGEVKQSWDNGDWTATDTVKQNNLLGMLLQSRAIRVNGEYKDADNIPTKFVEILCQGASGGLKPAVRRDLTIHGFILPSGEKRQEFQPYDWNSEGARYGVSNPLLAAYYCDLLEKRRQLKVDVDREVTSCIDLLLRALPYLNFAEVVAVKVQNEKVQYTSAIIRMLQSLGFGNVAALEDGANGKVDIYFLQDKTTFAIEAVMAKQSLGDIAEHRSRFDNRSKPNYQKAAKKCLVIIGKLDRVQTCVREVQGGIEVVGLAPNEGCVGYTVCVKREGEGVVEFDIECDGVAKKLTSLNKTPYFEVAQKLQSIAPGY